MAKRSITREVGPLAFRAAVVPETLDEEKRTVDLVWTTGARVLRGFFDRYWEELSLKPAHVRMERLNSGRAPLLQVHDAYGLSSVIGVVEWARIRGKEGTARVRFARAEDDLEADKIFRKVKDRIISNVSVGYWPHRMEKVEDGDDKVPVYRAVDWEPYEISMVPIGADVGAVVRSDGAATKPCEFIEEKNMDDDEEQKTDDKTERNASEERAHGAKAERARIKGIERVASALATPADVVARHIDDGTSLDKFRELAIDLRAEKETIVIERRIEVGADVTRASARDGLSNALLHRIAPGSFKLEDIGRAYRGLTLLEAGRAFLEAHGVRTAGLGKLDLAGMALGLGTRAGNHSTSDFPLILADVAGKTLRRAYDEAPQTFQPWARRVTLPDFKQVKRTQFGEAPALTKVLEGGEFTRGTIGEGREVYQLSTFGKVFAITRQALINDDMDAFSRVPMLFGRSARDLESDLVYAHFLSNPTMGDGVALFAANHVNIGTGAISIAALGAGRTAMRKQRGLDKKQRINVQAKYLLVPAALETTAEQFVSTQLLANASNQVNVFAGRLQVIAEPRLDDTSAVEWYLTADPGAIDTLEYGYLEGEDGPFLESRVGFDVDGLELKARHDFAAKVIDHRGFYKSSGA
jgi:hypothetical protein